MPVPYQRLCLSDGQGYASAVSEGLCLSDGQGYASAVSEAMPFRRPRLCQCRIRGYAFQMAKAMLVDYVTMPPALGGLVSYGS